MVVMRGAGRTAIAAAFGFLASAAVAAAPAISIKTDAVEIAVEIDPLFKSYPGLFDNCLAEGRRYAEAMRAGAVIAKRDDPAAFRDNSKWSYERAYLLRSAIGYYVSIVRNDSSYEGGAHPNVLTDTILWDSGAQKRISIRSFFTETADNGPAMNALAEAARLDIAAIKISRGIPAGDAGKLDPKMTPQQYLRRDSFIAGGIKASLLGLGPVTLAPSSDPDKSSGLTFHYSPYAVGPYVESIYSAFVPWTAFSQYLSHQGQAIFGGARPKDDEKW